MYVEHQSEACMRATISLVSLTRRWDLYCLIANAVWWASSPLLLTKASMLMAIDTGSDRLGNQKDSRVCINIPPGFSKELSYRGNVTHIETLWYEMFCRRKFAVRCDPI